MFRLEGDTLEASRLRLGKAVEVTEAGIGATSALEVANNASELRAKRRKESFFADASGAARAQASGQLADDPRLLQQL